MFFFFFVFFFFQPEAGYEISARLRGLGIVYRDKCLLGVCLGVGIGGGGCLGGPPPGSWSAHGWLMIDSWQVWHVCPIPQHHICRCALKPTRYKIIKPRPYKHNASHILIVRSAEGFREIVFAVWHFPFRVLLVDWCPGKYVYRMDSAWHQSLKTSFIANVAQVSRCTSHCLLPC